MSDHQHSADIDAPADKLFDYLSEIRNLPAYFSAMTSVEAADGDAVASSQTSTESSARRRSMVPIDRQKTTSNGAPKARTTSAASD